MRFGELEALLREQAELRVCGPMLLADDAALADAGVERDRMAAYVAARLAFLAERIAAYGDDEPVRALAEAALAVG